MSASTDSPYADAHAHDALDEALQTIASQLLAPPHPLGPPHPLAQRTSTPDPDPSPSPTPEADLPEAPLPPNGPAALNLAQQMMFKGDFCNYDPVILQSMRNGFNAELNLLAAPDQTIAVSSSDLSTLDAKLCSTFAAMATMFSSYGQGFVYDSTSVQLWLKPTWIHAWLRRATESEYSQFCIGARRRTITRSLRRT